MPEFLKVHFKFNSFLASIAIVSFFVIFFLIFTASANAATGINRQINFQGKLVTNPGGTNVSNTNYTIVFTFYNNPNAGQGTALWTETQTVTTTDGIFRVALGSVTPFPANFNFNWDGLYLGINVNSNGEMTPRIQMAAVPFAFNAQQVAGLTVQDTSGNASTSGTLQVANAKTVTFGGAFSTTVGNDVAFTTTAGTTLTLPTTGTLLTNTAAANQTITSTQATGTLLGVADSTGLSGAITGIAITLSGTGAQDQTGLSFNLSGASGTNLNDIVGTGSSWKISKTGALTVASCSGCGGVGSTNYWGLNNGNGTTTGGLLYNGNQTADFAIAGTSTASALFSFSGVLTGHTIASASGNLILMANNGWGGMVGIGQETPAEALDVNGNIKVGTTTTGTIRATDELVLRQDGDTYGSSILRLRNRTGENGAMFETTDPTVTLVDFIFKTASNQRNIRYESRVASAKVGNPSFHIGGASSDSPTLAVGDTYAAISNKLAIGSYTDPGSYALSVAGTGYFSSDLSLAGTTGITLSGNGAGIAFSGNGINAITTALNQNLAINPGGFGLVGINTDGVSPLANFDVRGNIGTLAVASVSGTTSFASLVANNDGVGDLFTASKSGLPIFTVKNSGQLVVGAPYYNTCTLKTDTNGVVTCGTDLQGSGGGASYIEQSNGLTYVGNTTTDFAIGGSSTGSAKFVFGVGTNGGLAIATFSGQLTMEAQSDSSVFDQSNWQQISGTAGTMGGNNSQIASISAMASYNGSLYVGTYKNPSGTAGSAEVYRYNGNGTSWTLVSQSGGTGQIASGGTSGIASVSAMAVFDGYLYVGTSKMNGAEVYRYNGSSSWTKVSAPTAGTIGCTVTSCTPTANINGVTSLAVYQGALYAGTMKPAAAQLYRYVGGSTWTLVNTTTIGTFVTTNTVAVSAITNMVVKNGFLYLGMLRPGDADVLRYSGGEGTGASTTFLSMNLGSATGSYSINGNAVTTFDEVTAMTVYNGAVIVALRRGNGQADVLQLNDGMQSGTTSPNSWTRLNNAIGQMTNGGTTTIDSVTSLTVYNGLLYAGTNDAGKAEIYRYVGGDQRWVLVSQPGGTGQIASGGTSGIYGIAKLLPLNGDLYAGTYLGLKAEVYKLSNVNIDKSYSIVFHALPSIAGGEQSGIDNTASIFYLASASANLGNTSANTGAFIFDHAIQTRNGSYDVAEDYATRDDTLKPGDVVAIDPNESGFVKKTSEAYDSNVLGVFSSNPALRLSQQDAFISGGYVVPVALAGRVPVKVSTESGEIKPGDYLTPSSVPGVAMKATKSSIVFAQAMEGYSKEGVGEVLSYIKSMTYQGAIADNFANLNTNSPDFAVNVLDRLKTQNPTDGKSEVITDRLIAGLEVITPSIVTKNLTADTINAKTIKADHIEGLEIYTNRLGSLADAVKSLEVLTNSQSVLGIATSSASLVQNSASETQNSNLANTFTLTSLNVEGFATVSADLNVKGRGFFEGALNVLESITTQNLTVSDFAYFINDVVFKGNVRFNQVPTFSKDTAGFAAIKKGDDTVAVNFDQEYNQIPVVTASIVLDKVGDSVLQKQLEDSILNGNITYVITQRTTKGFVIRLSKPAPEDLNFSWIALSVKDANTSGINPTLSPSFPATPSAGAQSILNLINNSPGPPN